MTNFEVSGTDLYYSDLVEDRGSAEKGVEQEPQQADYPERKIQQYEQIASKREALLDEETDTMILDADLPPPQTIPEELRFDTTISRYSRRGMDVTEVIINNDRILRVYHLVTHYWGGIFYFKNYRSISRIQFNLETQLDRKDLVKPTVTSQSAGSN